MLSNAEVASAKIRIQLKHLVNPWGFIQGQFPDPDWAVKKRLDSEWQQTEIKPSYQLLQIKDLVDSDAGGTLLSVDDLFAKKG